MCTKCKNKLIPILYGQLTPDLIDLYKQGKLVIGDTNAIDRPSWYCVDCTEAF